MKEDETLLLFFMQSETRLDEFPHTRELAKRLNMHPKRAAYICEKWTRKGLYNYGVNVLAGWLTPKGMGYQT